VKLNKGGLKLCAVYLCYFVLMVIVAETAPEPRGAAFLAILPFGIVIMLLASVGLHDLIGRVLENALPYVALLSVLVSFIIVYLTGWAGSTFLRAAKAVKSDPSMPVVDPPGWSDRR
jgi:hypothetical protein